MSQAVATTTRHAHLLADQLLEFGLIGALSTATYVLLYALLSPGTPALAANATALLVTGVGSTLANRHFTFRLRGRGRLGQEAQEIALTLLLGFAASSVALTLLESVVPSANQTAQMAALVAGNILAALVRFWVFRSTLMAKSV
jgi:putative flippase GtrA